MHATCYSVPRKRIFIARKTNAKKQQRKIFAFGYSAWTIFSLWLPTLNCFRLRLLRIDYFQPMGTPSPSGLTINPHLKFKTHTFTEPIFLQTRLEIIAPECNVKGGGYNQNHASLKYSSLDAWTYGGSFISMNKIC